MAIAKDDIFRVANELDAAGQNPTLAAVRKVLGAGSFTTISEAMAEWRSVKAARENPIKEPAPTVIAERLGELGAQIWALALEQAQARLAGERAALDEMREAWEIEKAQAAELADQVGAELEEAHGQLQAATAAAVSARQEVETIKTRLEKAALEAATSKVQVQEIERRANDLNAELQRLNDQNKDLIAALRSASTPPPPPSDESTR